MTIQQKLFIAIIAVILCLLAQAYDQYSAFQHKKTDVSANAGID